MISTVYSSLLDFLSDGKKSMASNVTTAEGYDVKCTDDSRFKEVVKAAQNAQAVMVVVGPEKIVDIQENSLMTSQYNYSEGREIVITYLYQASQKTSLWLSGVLPRTFYMIVIVMAGGMARGNYLG